jgi:hypothetical protein
MLKFVLGSVIHVKPRDERLHYFRLEDGKRIG